MSDDRVNRKFKERKNGSKVSGARPLIPRGQGRCGSQEGRQGRLGTGQLQFLDVHAIRGSRGANLSSEAPQVPSTGRL